MLKIALLDWIYFLMAAIYVQKSNSVELIPAMISFVLVMVNRIPIRVILPHKLTPIEWDFRAEALSGPADTL